MSEQKENSEVQNNEPVKPVSKKKKRLIVWSSVIVAIFLILLFLPGIIVQHVVPPVATQLLKVKVEVDSAFINIFDGAVRIKGMRIHNPAGYSDPLAFNLGHFYVDVEMLTLASPKIVIKDVIVEDMHADLEMKWGTNNLAEIGKALQNPDDGKKAAEPEKEEKKPEADKPAKEPKKMVIRRFILRDCDFTMLRVPWPIPSVELTDVGDGRPVSEFVLVVYDAIVDAVIQASKAIGKAAGNVGKGIGKAADNISKSTKEAGAAVNDAVKSTGKALEDAGKSLKNIFK